MTKRFAVLGNPIKHSLSPQMHNAWIADHGFDAVYDRALIESDAALSLYIESNTLDGANITVPLKEAAARFAARGPKDVANTLKRESDGSYTAHNTDGRGFTSALDEAVPGWRATNILILGAGGAAAGIAQTLASADRHITIANRTRARAEELAATIANARAAAWEDLPNLFATTDLIIQCTTLGLSGTASPDWPVERCKPEALIVDIIYRPLETPLLKAARARGLRAVDGLGMLIHQGALAFEIWFGVKPDTAKARARLLAILEEGG